PTTSTSSGGINVSGSAKFSAEGGDIVGGDKITNNYYAPRQLRAQTRLVFDREIKSLTKGFVGRKAELTRVREFINSRVGGYRILTSPAGFGKSALMAFLISEMPAGFIYHFFTPDPKTLNEQFFLKNMVEQLAKRFGDEDEPPSDIMSLLPLFWKYMKV